MKFAVAWMSIAEGATGMMIAVGPGEHLLQQKARCARRRIDDQLARSRRHIHFDAAQLVALRRPVAP